jgi:hypothetical protein
MFSLTAAAGGAAADESDDDAAAEDGGTEGSPLALLGAGGRLSGTGFTVPARFWQAIDAAWSRQSKGSKRRDISTSFLSAALRVRLGGAGNGAFVPAYIALERTLVHVLVAEAGDLEAAVVRAGLPSGDVLHAGVEARGGAPWARWTRLPRRARGPNDILMNEFRTTEILTSSSRQRYELRRRPHPEQSARAFKAGRDRQQLMEHWRATSVRLGGCMYRIS